MRVVDVLAGIRVRAFFLFWLLRLISRELVKEESLSSQGRNCKKSTASCQGSHKMKRHSSNTGGKTSCLTFRTASIVRTADLLIMIGGVLFPDSGKDTRT